MEGKQTLKNMVEAMKLMNDAQLAQLAAFSEGLKFAALRQAEKNNEQ